MAAVHGERDTITITEGESTDLFIAKDEATGVASQGETKIDALGNLVEALELYYDEDESAFARELSRQSISNRYGDDYFAKNPDWADGLPDLGEG